MISPERLDSLQRQWVALLEPDGVTPAAAYPVFDELVAAYTEPHRHYHTLEHLAEMFRVLGRLAGRCENVRAVHLAVWFHDAVYDPKAKDNEERSAVLAADRLGALGVPAELCDWVAKLVRATAHLADDSPPPDADTAVLLDADLAILGSAEVRYRRYAAAVRKEYEFVPDDQYRAGRTAVLRRFLSRPRLYQSPVMHEEGDEPARRNIRTELDELG